MTIAHFFQLQPITAGAFAVCVALALLNAVTKRETMCVVRGSDGVSMAQWWWWPLYASMAVAIDTVRMIVWSTCHVARPNQSFALNAFVLVPESRCVGGVFGRFAALTVVCLSNLLLLSVGLFAVQAAACGDIGSPMLWGPITLVFAWSARLASVRVARRRRRFEGSAFDLPSGLEQPRACGDIVVTNTDASKTNNPIIRDYFPPPDYFRPV